MESYTIPRTVGSSDDGTKCPNPWNRRCLVSHKGMALTEPGSPRFFLLYLDRQTSSVVLQVHHSDRHSLDGTQDSSKRSSLGREQLAEL